MPEESVYYTRDFSLRLERTGIELGEAIYLASAETLRSPLNRHWLMRVAEASPLAQTFYSIRRSRRLFLYFGRSNCEALLSTAEKQKQQRKNGVPARHEGNKLTKPGIFFNHN